MDEKTELKNIENYLRDLNLNGDLTNAEIEKLIINTEKNIFNRVIKKERSHFNVIVATLSTGLVVFMMSIFFITIVIQSNLTNSLEDTEVDAALRNIDKEIEDLDSELMEIDSFEKDILSLRAIY